MVTGRGELETKQRTVGHACVLRACRYGCRLAGNVNLATVTGSNAQETAEADFFACQKVYGSDFALPIVLKKLADAILIRND